MLEAKVQQIKDHLDSKGIVVPIEKDSTLSLDNPGIYKKGVVKVFDGLPPELLPEVEIHELSHAILDYRGVLSIDIVGNYGQRTASGGAELRKIPLEDLLRKVQQISFTELDEIDISKEQSEQLTEYKDISDKTSNAIHHKSMVTLLRDEFHIVPNQYYSLMRSWLSKTALEILSANQHTLINYSNGIFLYDISNVLTSEIEEITRVAGLNAEVQKAFFASKLHLDRIDVYACLPEQFTVVCEFFTALGIDPKRFLIFDFYGRTKKSG